MRTDSGKGRLYDALKQIRLRWNEVDDVWNDPVKVDFEEKIWTPLEMMTADALRAMDQLAQIFLELKQDCDDTNIMRAVYS